MKSKNIRVSSDESNDEYEKMLKPTKLKLVQQQHLLRRRHSNMLFLLLVCAIVLIFVYQFNSLISTTFYDNFFKHTSDKPNNWFLNKVYQQLYHQKANISSIVPAQIGLNKLETMQLAESESNVAAVFWYNWKENQQNWKRLKNNVTYCENVKLTSPYGVKHHNVHWQKFVRSENDSTNIEMYLYNAYYDNRIVAKPVVRLISINNKQTVIEQKKWSCLLWFEDIAHPVLANVTDLYIIWPKYWGLKDGIYGTQIISCAIPDAHSGDIPKAVSLQSQSECNKVEENPSNVLRIIHNLLVNVTQKHPSIGVCVKSLRYGTLDYSVRLVEWLELVRILAGEKVYIYVLGAVDNIVKVLEHYQADGLVEWRHTTLVDAQPNLGSLSESYAADEMGWGFWQEELLEYNDCLYRNLFVHDFIVVMDVDELIVPQSVDNWLDLIQKVNSSKAAYFSSVESRIVSNFQEKSYIGESGSTREVPDYLYTMRHTRRSPVHSQSANIKCLHRTSMVTAVHNHYPMHCLNTSGHHSCWGVTMSERDSLMMHYRMNELPKCGNLTAENTSPEVLMTNCTVHDRNMWRYFDRLEAQVRERLWKIFGNGINK